MMMDKSQEDLWAFSMSECSDSSSNSCWVKKGSYFSRQSNHVSLSQNFIVFQFTDFFISWNACFSFFVLSILLFIFLLSSCIRAFSWLFFFLCIRFLFASTSMRYFRFWFSSDFFCSSDNFRNIFTSHEGFFQFLEFSSKLGQLCWKSSSFNNQSNWVIDRARKSSNTPSCHSDGTDLIPNDFLAFFMARSWSKSTIDPSFRRSWPAERSYSFITLFTWFITKSTVILSSSFATSETHLP